MKRAIAKIRFLTTEEGGRKCPVPLMNLGFPVFWKNLPALSQHGWDCRLLVPEHGAEIMPGETVEELGMIFLSPDVIFSNIHSGVRFSLWEGGTVAHGEIIRIEE